VKNWRAIDKNFDFDAFINAPTVRAFIGKNYDHYKEIWGRDYAKKKSVTGIISSFHLNWLGLLAGPVSWFSYRKMYGAAIGVTIVYCAATLVEYYYGKPFPTAGFVGVNVAIASMAKGQYFAHVMNFLEKNNTLSQAMFEQRIARDGGVSWPLAVAGFILSIAAIIGCAAIGEIVFGPLEGVPPLLENLKAAADAVPAP
jgi:hypothetical protein